MDAVDFSRWIWNGHKQRFLSHRRHDPGAVGEMVETDGALLRVLVDKRSGAGSDTLVIVPDPPNVIEQYLPVIEHFAGIARVVCVETPGFGHSYIKPGFRFDVPSCCNVFEQLFDRLDIRNAVLDMSCLGSFVGIAFSGARPDRVRHLLLQQASTIPQAKRWAKGTDRLGLIGTPFAGQLFMRSLSRPIARNWYTVSVPAGSARLAQGLAASTDASLARGACFCLCNAYQSLMAMGDALPAERPKRTTLTWGGADPTHKQSQPTALHCEMADAEFHLFEDCGHFPMLEDPARYLPLVHAALAA